MALPTILLVSHDESVCSAVEQVVDRIGHCQYITADDIDHGILTLWESDAVILLVHATVQESFSAIQDFIRGLTALQKNVPTIVISEGHDPTQALKLLKLGVADVLSRPLNLGRLSFLLETLTVRYRHELTHWPEETEDLGDDEKLLAVLSHGSSVMRNLMRHIRKSAGHEFNVLLTGETGTGKTRLARLIHDLSAHRDGPFRVVNCAAVPTSLLESTLFGHVKGAFTSADSTHHGVLEEVGNGTLLLDDVDTLPLEAQGKLLRVLEERAFEPVGSTKTLPFRGRLLSASNRPLEQDVAEHKFRADLYYRLAVIQIHVPPLRDRTSEIRLLVRLYLRDLCDRESFESMDISDEAVAALKSYEWPGNIRELHNVIDAAAAMSNGRRIGIQDLPIRIQEQYAALTESVSDTEASFGHNGTPLEASLSEAPPEGRSAGVDHPEPETAASPPNGAPLKTARRRAEIETIMRALKANNFNRAAAARSLGISRAAFYKKLAKYSLTDVRKSGPTRSRNKSVE